MQLLITVAPKVSKPLSEIRKASQWQVSLSPAPRNQYAVERSTPRSSDSDDAGRLKVSDPIPL